MAMAPVCIWANTQCIALFHVFKCLLLAELFPGPKWCFFYNWVNCLRAGHLTVGLHAHKHPGPGEDQLELFSPCNWPANTTGRIAVFGGLNWMKPFSSLLRMLLSETQLNCDTNLGSQTTQLEIFSRWRTLRRPRGWIGVAGGLLLCARGMGVPLPPPSVSQSSL